MPRAFLACLLLGLAGCAEIGRPWPHLTEAQQAERDAWTAELQQQVISRLQQADVQLTATPRNGGGSQDAVELHITVDRHGEVSLVKIASPSARPGLAERLLKIITEAGPLTAPPASLMAFNQYLTVKISFDVNAGRAPTRQA